MMDTHQYKTRGPPPRHTFQFSLASNLKMPASWVNMASQAYLTCYNIGQVRGCVLSFGLSFFFAKFIFWMSNRNL